MPYEHSQKLEAKMARLGLIVVATETGLGYQTRDYYRHLKPDKTILVDISSINGKQQHYDWYENAMIINGMPTDQQLDMMLDDIDVLLTAETMYNLNLYARAKARGVKTICVENPEFYDHMMYPEYAMPDVIILPSTWLEPLIRTHAQSRKTKVVQLHHPVDRDEFPFRERRTNTIMHLAGNPAMHDRNGTYNFLDAYPTGTVVTQDEGLAGNLRNRYRHSTVWTEVHDNKQIYEMADVMVLPRKYGGNCLPLNEALSCGMPVIMTDISPNDTVLPREWLVPAVSSGQFSPRFPIDIYEADPVALREKIEWLEHTDISVLSRQADAIADTISWKTLLPKWQEVIDAA